MLLSEVGPLLLGPGLNEPADEGTDERAEGQDHLRREGDHEAQCALARFGHVASGI